MKIYCSNMLKSTLAGLLGLMMILGLTLKPTELSAQLPGFQISSPHANSWLTYPDLWNIDIITAGQHTFTGFFIVIKVVRQNTGLVLTSHTIDFQMEPGITSFSSARYQTELNPSIDFASPEFAQIIAEGGHFPAGTYLLSYALYGKTYDIVMGQVTELLINASYDQTVTAFFPAVLLEPADETVFYYNNTNNIFFSWTPAFIPAQGGISSVEYDLSIYRVYDGQTPDDAAASNPPVYIEMDIEYTFLDFPLVAQTFDNNTQYAWKVETHYPLIRIPIAVTDVWSFSFTDQPGDSTILPPTPKIKIYFPAQDKLISNYAFDNSLDSLGNKMNTLRFTFQEPYNITENSLLSYKIYDENRTLVEGLPELEVKYMDNFCAIDLAALDISTGYYYLEVMNVKNEKMFLRFYYSE
jgi:hypothetical protein